MEANPDSFNQQMANDMKKCVQKAHKEHGLPMSKERAIIDNLKYSEDWFINTYSSLKSALGGNKALVDVDFKDFI